MFVWRVLGLLILSANLVLDTAYIFLSKFANTTLYGLYVFVLGARYTIVFLAIVRNCIKKVNEPLVIKKENSDKSNGSKQVDKEAAYFKNGVLLYGALPFCYLVGSHRVLNFKNFSSEMGVGLLIDFFSAGIAFLLIQVIN